MIRGLLSAFVSSLLGTLGFAVLLRAPRRAWIPASVSGALAFTLYWFLMQVGASEASAIFCGSLAGSVLGHILSMRMKLIGTIFNALGIVAFVPGLGLYRCMELLAMGNPQEGVQAGVSAMVSILMIALGLSMGHWCFRVFHRSKRKGRQEKRRRDSTPGFTAS